MAGVTGCHYWREPWPPLVGRLLGSAPQTTMWHDDVIVGAR
jgi:hypothetical protein